MSGEEGGEWREWAKMRRKTERNRVTHDAADIPASAPDLISTLCSRAQL